MHRASDRVKLIRKEGDGMEKKKTSEAKRRAVAKYDAANTRFFGLKLNKNTDAELIEKLEHEPNMQAYIKELIREDLRNN